jgi:hypothetical protein
MEKLAGMEKEMEHLHVDKSLFPIIIITNLPVPFTDRQFDLFLDYQAELVQSAPEKIAIIYNISKAKFMTSAQRVRAGNWSKENGEILSKNSISCIVNNSVVMNIMLKGMMLIDKSISKVEIFNSLPEAITWSKENLKK